jgi:putative nucleotidyltransferase with HDIG domain
MTTTPAESGRELADGQGTAWLRTSEADLPMLSSLAHRVIALIGDPEVKVAQLSMLVSKEQVLASRVLALANSVYSSPSMPITTVKDAIVRLGTTAIRNVVITVSFTSQLAHPAIYGTRGRALAEHGIGTAYLARLIAEQAGANVEEAHLYGLLHDIGKLIILKRAYEFRRAGHSSPSDEEIEWAIRDHHAEVGGRALRRWKLPETLDEPVMYHHDYARAPENLREAAIAYLANLLSHRFGFGCESEAIDVLADPACGLLAIDQKWLDATDARAPGLFAVAREILS